MTDACPEGSSCVIESKEGVVQGNAWIVRRATVGLLVALVSGVLATAAWATPTPSELAEKGWSCGLTPPQVSPQRIVCGNPGTGRPFPGNLDPRPTYHLLLFDLNGELFARIHFVREDLYAGQPCHGGDPYVFSQVIRYYECRDLVKA